MSTREKIAIWLLDGADEWSAMGASDREPYLRNASQCIKDIGISEAALDGLVSGSLVAVPRERVAKLTAALERIRDKTPTDAARHLSAIAAAALATASEPQDQEEGK